MRNAATTRKKSWRTVAGSVLTLLAMLATPLCAPLCAARTCSQSALTAASERHCHAAASMHDDVPQIQATLNCNPPELAVAALSAGNTIDILRGSCSASQAASYPAAFLEFGSGFVARRENLS